MTCFDYRQTILKLCLENDVVDGTNRASERKLSRRGMLADPDGGQTESSDERPGLIIRDI